MYEVLSRRGRSWVRKSSLALSTPATTPAKPARHSACDDDDVRLPLSSRLTAARNLHGSKGHGRKVTCAQRGALHTDGRLSSPTSSSCRTGRASSTLPFASNGPARTGSTCARHDPVSAGSVWQRCAGKGDITPYILRELWSGGSRDLGRQGRSAKPDWI